MERTFFNKKFVIGIFVSILFIILILYKLNWQSFFEAFKIINVKYSYLFISVYILNLFMRGIRQNILLSDQLNRLNSFLIFSVGNVLNICLPLRFGDFWRAYNIGKELDISKLQILGIITVERLMDSFSVIIVFGFALIKYMQNQVAVSIFKSAFIGVFSIVLILGLLFLLLSRKIVRSKLLEKFTDGIKVIRNKKICLQVLSLSLLARFFECIIIYSLFLCFGLKISLFGALLTVILNALCAVIPSASSYVGAYQYSYILALSFYGVSKETSLAVVVVYQFVTLVLLGLISLFYLCKKNYSTLQM